MNNNLYKQFILYFIFPLNDSTPIFEFLAPMDAPLKYRKYTALAYR